MISYQTALKYLDKRMSIFPVILDEDEKGKINKRPAIKWQEYTKRLPTPEEVKEWFQDKKFNGIGMATGKVSGLVVIDVESYADQETMLMFKSQMVSKTISGGKHFFYKYDEELRNTVKLFGKDVDFRGDGGYVVLPPSSYYDKQYSWISGVEDFSKLDVIPLDVRKQLKSGLESKNSLPVNVVLPDDSEMPFPRLTEGGRNDMASRVAGVLLSSIPRKFWNSSAWLTLKEWNAGNNPPLPEWELKNTFESIKNKDLSQYKLEGLREEADLYEILSGQEANKRYLKMEEDFGNGITTGFLDLDEYFKFLPEQLYLLSAQTSHGKCLGENEKILMFDGSIKESQDIKVGDLLMGDDSTPRKVLSITSGVDDLYKITPRNNRSFVVNKPHVLTLKKTGDTNESKYKGKITSKRYSKGKIIDIPLNKYLEKSNYFKHRYKLFRNGVEFNNNHELEIDPYFLGLWLGDGTSSQPQITTQDGEIKYFLHKMAKKNGYKVTITNQSKKVKRISLTGENYNGKRILTILKEINVYKNKHIPFKYKTSSREERLKLLAGLIDSDGYKNKKSYTFSNTNYKLAKDVEFVANSLGFAAHTKRRISRGFGVEIVSYRVTILGDCSKIPILIKRKFCGYRVRKDDHNVFCFKVSSIGRGKYYGFTLDGNGRFLLDNCIVTHNTTLALNMSTKIAMSGKKVLFASLEQGPYVVPRIKAIAGGIYPNGLDLMITKDMASVKGLTEIVENLKEKPDILMVDHLHFFKRGGKGMTQDIDEMIINIQNMAKQLQIPVVVIAHMRKINEDKAPGLNDLRDSSSLSQVPSVVMLLWRKINDEDYMEESYLSKFGTIFIAKNRIRGKTGLLPFELKNSGEFIFPKSVNEIKEKVTRNDYLLEDF